MLAALVLAACPPGKPDPGDPSGDTTAAPATGEPPTDGTSPTGEGTTAATSTTTTTTADGSTTGAPGTSTSGTSTSGTSDPGTSSSSSSSGAVDPSSTAGSSGETGDTGAPGCGGEPLLQVPGLAVEAGLEQCPDGTIHRHTAVACIGAEPAQACDLGVVCNGEPCDDLGDGTCAEFPGPSCRCAYPCLSDADCADDAACLCNSSTESGYHYITASECRPANCRTDGDCGAFECGLSLTSCWLPEGLFCRSALDLCKTDQECLDQGLGDNCRFDAQQQRWACEWMLRCP